MQKWRWIDTGEADGATQMALDMAVLQCSAITKMAAMRVYAWNPFCISLGYNQDLGSINKAACEKAGIHVVRRPTGGRAVYHARELTYSVIIPKTDPSYDSRVAQMYHLISRGLARGIQTLGVPAVLEKQTVDFKAHYKDPISVSCFSAAARHEILVNGRKLVGSAQRHMESGMLQHGSILTGDDHLDLPSFLSEGNEAVRLRLRKTIDSKTISIGQYLNREVSYKEAANAVRAGMEEEAGIRFEDQALIPEEEKCMNALRSDFMCIPEAGVQA